MILVGFMIGSVICCILVLWWLWVLSLVLSGWIRIIMICLFLRFDWLVWWLLLRVMCWWYIGVCWVGFFFCVVV